MDYWIDERGRLWPGDSFRSKHDGFVVMAFGLVRLESHGSTLTLSFAPERVTPNALQAVREIVNEAFANQIVTLRYYLGGWATELYYGPTKALARIDQLTEGSIEPPGKQARMERGNPRWDPKAMPLIANLAARWEERKGILAADDPLVFAAMQKAVVFERPKGTFGFRWIGGQSMYQLYHGESVCRAMIGQAYFRSPGTMDYRNIVDRCYGRSMDLWQPRYDQIRTLFSKNPKEPIWFHYQRLLLPIRQASGEDGLLVLCEETPHLTVPLDG